MDFFLSKLIPLFVYPAGLASLLLIAALIFWKKQKFSRWMVVLAFAVIFILGNRWVSMTIVRSLEQRYLPQEKYAKADVAIVLGGGTDPVLYPRLIPEVNGAGDRVVYAVKLYKDGIVDHIIVTGGTVEWQGTFATSPAQDMSSLLQLMGVPADAIIEEGESLNTYEDAAFSTKIVQDHGWKNVILVTSALHMPRAMMEYEQIGLTVTPAPVDYTITDQEWADLLKPTFENVLINLLPTSANLKSTTSSMKEYIGMAVNKITD